MTTILSPNDLPINEIDSKSERTTPLKTSNYEGAESYPSDGETNENSCLNSLHNFDVSISTPVFRFQGGALLNAIAYCSSAVFIEETFFLVIILLHCIFGL